METATDEVMDFLSRLKKSGEAHIFGCRARTRSVILPNARAVRARGQPAGTGRPRVGRAARVVVGDCGASRSGPGQKADMVTRREDDHDRRVKRVRLSEHGSTFVGSLVQAHRAAVRECLQSLSDHERAQLSQALAPILARGDQATITTGC